MRKDVYAVAVSLMLSFFFGVLVYEHGCAHVQVLEKRDHGLFHTLVYPSVRCGEACERFDSDGPDAGFVVQINGIAAFNKNVINASMLMPVLLNVCSAQSRDAKKVKSELQAVAKKFVGKIGCVSLDLFSFHENYQIVLDLMHRQNIQKLDPPLFIFFYKGSLHATEKKPAAILHGFHTRENLESVIKQKFFS